MPCAFKALVTKLVINLAFAVVAQNFIGFRRFFKFVFSLFIIRILVRMIFDGNFSVSLLQRNFICIPLYPKDFIVIWFFTHNLVPDNALIHLYLCLTRLYGSFQTCFD